MHNGVMARHDPVKQLGVAAVAVDEVHAVLGDALEVVEIPCVCERIQHRHMRLGMIVYNIMHEIRTNKTGPTRNNNVPWNKCLSHGCILSHGKDVGANPDMNRNGDAQLPCRILIEHRKTSAEAWHH